MAESKAVGAGERQPGEVSTGIHPVQNGVTSDSKDPGGKPSLVVPSPRTDDADSDHDARDAPELPTDYLATELAHAERLLSYATELGLEMDEETRSAIFSARATSDSSMSQAAAGRLLVALAKLAARVSPITAESLRASGDPTQTRAVLRFYTKIAAALAVICVTFSAATFVSSALSDAVRKDVDTANALALNLADEARQIAAMPKDATASSATGDVSGGASAKDMLKELQQFAVAIRAINEHGRQLRWFSGGFAAPLRPLAPASKARHEIELRVPLDTLSDERDEAIAKITLYQDVRYNAVSAQEGASLLTGGLATCVLPVLYAVLGACAYLLRLFEEQIRKRTFTADTHRARFFIAAIGGLVIGLFNNFNLTQSGSLPPLGLAFLVGYAVDVFFSFLEGVLQTFARTHATAGGPADSKG